MSEVSCRSEMSMRNEGLEGFVAGIVVPWNIELRGRNGEREVFSPGAFDRGQPDNPVHLRWQHTSQAPGRPPIGVMTRMRSEAEGQWVEFKLSQSSPLAAEIGGLLHDGTLDRFSIEFVSIVPAHSNRKELQGAVREGVLTAVAVIERGAYGGHAGVQSVRDETIVPPSMLSRAWVDLQRTKNRDRARKLHRG